MAMKPIPSTLCPTPSAGRAEGRLDREKAEHERATQEPGVQIGVSQARHRRRHGHEAEQVVGEGEADQAHSRARGEGIQHGRASGAGGRVGAPLAVASRRHRDQPDLHHLAERQQYPDVEARRRHRRERRRADQSAHPDRIDEVEREMARHHGHGGEGEPQDHWSQRPDRERARGAGDRRQCTLAFARRRALLSYSERSAALNSVSRESPSRGYTATPTLTERGGFSPSRATRSEMRRATCHAAASSVSGSTTANSSPPNRAAVSIARHDPNSVSATRHSARLPTRWPWLSLIFFKPSMSSSTTANGRSVRW